ncbi:MAG: phosphoribosylformylglycinamidine synthase [Treponema sp.]|jgi:phosphoribosylformylglycinamidine synthase|nr:phosphoribosylformylglycinamidine synthase [Treponema sp.]
MPVPVKRIFVEKRPGFDVEARRLKTDIMGFLGPQYPALARLTELRVFNRYELFAGLTEDQFRRAVSLVFSEPPRDRVFYQLPLPPDNAAAMAAGAFQVFGVEYLPGQYDQRADSAEQCLELILGTRPPVRCARFYLLASELPLGNAEMGAVKAYLINPVDSRETAEDASPDSVEHPAAAGLGAGANPGAAAVPGGAANNMPVLEGFSALKDPNRLAALGRDYGLAMSDADLACCRDYFASEGRDPTLTELRVLDTYWSDHCRHTTFTTILKSLKITGQGRDRAPLQKALALYDAVRREVYGPGAKTRPRTLMDMATIGAKVLKKRGLLEDLDESEEINACTIKVRARFEGSAEDVPYLLLFKNETHNHPTEIEPFGGAATCLGGAIRDPLSGRAYVYQAMRITGGGDPRGSLTDTLPGKLPQVKIAREAAAGYSSYGNQIGLAAGQVVEFYHPGYLAKRLELGAVIGAVPEVQVRRTEPVPGDLILLIGGKTGRDGIGGATGSSKVHTGESVETAGAEVQKGNAVEERKLQRLFRNPGFSPLVKRCNDFGAGGVSVAVGELAPGLDINLDAVPKKYAGLDGTELAISESQERMAVVCAPEHAETLIRLAAAENLDAVVIAAVTQGTEARLRMSWRGTTIVDLARTFLDSHGASRSALAVIKRRLAPSSGLAGPSNRGTPPKESLANLKAGLGSLRDGSRRGLQERFDGSIGAGSVLFPWGGREQGTPECGMAALLPAPLFAAGNDGALNPAGSDWPASPAYGASLTASLMTFGFDPVLTEADPYEGAKGAVKEALAKYACLGGDPWKARLSMQEYFERMESPESWGKPAAALLGALEAQLALGVPAIGGKDSMSGSYKDPVKGIDLAVPSTVVIFAAGTAGVASVRSGALSGKPGNPVILFYHKAPGGESPAGEWSRFRTNINALAGLTSQGLVLAAYPVGPGGVAAALALMAFGNMTGVEVRAGVLDLTDETNYPGAMLAEIDGGALKNSGEGHPADTLKAWISPDAAWVEAARTIPEPVFRVTSGDPPESAELPLEELRCVYEEPLSQVYPRVSGNYAAVGIPPSKPEEFSRPSVPRSPSIRGHRPLTVLPVFPGTNCEWDMERAFREAGAKTRLVIFRNRGPGDIAESIRELAEAIAEARIVALSGGFSAGDEPDGSGKFIANVFRTPAIAGAVNEFLEKREGLMLGICNGFQALIKLGLVPYGRYIDASENSPTLTFNRVGRHVSRMVRTRVMASPSPWLALEEPGTVHILPVSHGEGRLVIDGEEGRGLFKTGQVPFCYADAEGRPASSEPDNPNGSDFAIEGLTSPDGRILGKMGHSERRGPFVHINIPGNKVQRIFEAGVKYFRS